MKEGSSLFHTVVLIIFWEQGSARGSAAEWLQLALNQRLFYNADKLYERKCAAFFLFFFFFSQGFRITVRIPQTDVKSV